MIRDYNRTRDVYKDNANEDSIKEVVIEFVGGLVLLACIMFFSILFGIVVGGINGKL